MRQFIFFLLCLAAQSSLAQEYKDTTILIRGTACPCKYNLKAEDDLSISLSGGHGIKSTNATQPYYSTDADAWNKFLKKNLNKTYKGKDEVELRFQVDKNGDLSNFELISRAPAQKFQETVRVLKLSGKWFPEIRNGYCIGSSVRLTIEL
jgi:hypothetical protein